MFLEIIVAIMLGILFGIFTGLIPGIHINMVAVFLISTSAFFLEYVSGFILVVFIVSMSITHTFLDSIPSIFLGAPDSDQVLNVLPGHRLLLAGRGFEAVKLTLIGSFISLIVMVVIFAPIGVIVVSLIYDFISLYIGWLLVLICLFMIFIEKNKIVALFVFLLSGAFGIIVLNELKISQPLFPMLTGLFGTSSLLLSLNTVSVIPVQHSDEVIFVPFWDKFKAIFSACIFGSLAGMLPGMGSAQAAIIAYQFVRKIGEYGFMILVGGIGTVNFVFSIVTFYVIDRARNGSIVAVSEIYGSLGFDEFVILLFVCLLVGGVSCLLTLKFAKMFSLMIARVNYKKLVLSVISFVTLLVFYFTGVTGFIVMVISTFIGMIPALYGVKRSLLMGCLMLPVVLFFLL